MTGNRRRRFHIGFVLPSLSGGGAERSTLRLAQSLVERGHRADLVIPCFAGDYRAAIPRGVRLYRGRLRHTDRKSEAFSRDVIAGQLPSCFVHGLPGARAR